MRMRDASLCECGGKRKVTVGDPAEDTWIRDSVGGMNSASQEFILWGGKGKRTRQLHNS